MTGKPFGDDADAFEEALASGVLVEDRDRVDHYNFHHAMVHEVVLGELTASRRARLEWAAGQALEALFSDDPNDHAAAIARH